MIRLCLLISSHLCVLALVNRSPSEGAERFGARSRQVAAAAAAEPEKESGSDESPKTLDEADADDAGGENNDEKADEGAAVGKKSQSSSKSSKDSGDAEDKQAKNKERDDAKSIDAGEKSADAKKSKSDSPADKSKKPSADKTTPPKKTKKKPEIYVVKTKDLKIETELDGVFVTDDAEEVALRPEVWSLFKVVKSVAHGDRVHKGDVLIEFDDRDFEKSLADKSLEERSAEVSLLQAEEEMPRLERSVNLDLEIAQRAFDDAVDEYDRFKKTMRRLSEEYAHYELKSAEEDLANAREEMTQLEKMYKADDITEETEEIVLKQHKFRVEISQFWAKYSRISSEYTMNVSLPQREISLKDAVDEAKLALERAKMAKSLGLSKKRYNLESLREQRTHDVEDQAKLLADKSLLKIHAPRDGVVYFGRAIDGRWAEVASMEQKLIPFSMVSPNTILMTIVADRPQGVVTTVGEKEVTSVKEKQHALVSPAADDQLELEAAVASVGAIPGNGNQFTVRLDLKGEDLPGWIKPGMTGKIEIDTYEAKNAVVIPADILQPDAENPKHRYVMVEIEGREKPVRRDLKLGKRKAKDVEILSGLEKGDRIVKGAKDEPDENVAEEKDDAAEKEDKKDSDVES